MDRRTILHGAGAVLGVSTHSSGPSMKALLSSPVHRGHPCNCTAPLFLFQRTLGREEEQTSRWLAMTMCGISLLSGWLITRAGHFLCSLYCNSRYVMVMSITT